ncbi:unnamed protein product, partial [Tenebrio molitor]
SFVSSHNALRILFVCSRHLSTLRGQKTPILDQDLHRLHQQEPVILEGGKFFLENVTSGNFVHLHPQLVLKVVDEVRVKDCNLEDLHIPDSFDARKEWPHCADVIGNIKD